MTDSHRLRARLLPVALFVALACVPAPTAAQALGLYGIAGRPVVDHVDPANFADDGRSLGSEVGVGGAITVPLGQLSFAFRGDYWFPSCQAEACAFYRGGGTLSYMRPTLSKLALLPNSIGLMRSFYRPTGGVESIKSEELSLGWGFNDPMRSSLYLDVRANDLTGSVYFTVAAGVWMGG